MEINDVVHVKKNIPDSKIKARQQGVVVNIFTLPNPAVEVEFVDYNGCVYEIKTFTLLEFEEYFI